MRQEFPLVYRMSRAGRIFCISVGLIGIVAAGAGAVYFGFFYDKGGIDRAVFVGICLLFMLPSVPCIGSALRLRILVHADEIESRSFIRSKRMKRADIAGFRILVANGTSRLRLESGKTGVASLTLPPYVAYDDRMDAWLEGVANHDARERQASLDSILADPDMPGADGEKLEKLAGARRTAKLLFFASLALTGWIWFYPHPYLPLVCAAAIIPWIAVGIAAQNGTLYRINPARNDAAADLSSVFILPTCALFLRAVLDFNLLDAWKAFWWSLGAAAVSLAVMLLVLRGLRTRVGDLLAFGLFTLGYGFGVVTLANTLPDDSDPQRFEVRVIEKSTSGGSNRTSFDLLLPPWGPRSSEESVSVTRAFYGRVSAGDTVCVYLWAGALGVRWYEVLDCPKPGS